MADFLWLSIEEGFVRDSEKYQACVRIELIANKIPSAANLNIILWLRAWAVVARCDSFANFVSQDKARLRKDVEKKWKSGNIFGPNCAELDAVNNDVLLRQSVFERLPCKRVWFRIHSSKD